MLSMAAAVAWARVEDLSAGGLRRFISRSFAIHPAKCAAATARDGFPNELFSNPGACPYVEACDRALRCAQQ